MRRSAVRIYAAVLLVVYLAVATGSHVVALTCGCIMQHGRNSCRAVSECRHDCCRTPEAGAQYRSERCCDHSHSTDVELYTQVRPLTDAYMRLVSVAALAVTPCDGVEPSLYAVAFDYGEYLRPLLPGPLCAQPPLRAPPALV